MKPRHYQYCFIFAKIIECCESTCTLLKYIQLYLSPCLLSSFDKLLTVMEDYEHENVKELAKLIRASLRSSNSDNG